MKDGTSKKRPTGSGPSTWIRSMAAWTGMTLITLALSPFITLFAPISRPISLWITRVWARGLLWSVGAELEVRNESGLDNPPVGAVYVANHQSYLDIVSLIAGIDCGFKFLAKKTLLFLPGINIVLLGQRHFLVSKSNIIKTLRNIRKKAPEMLENGENLFVFPEGGRNWDGMPGDFKDGAAATAIWAGADLVPVAIIGAHEVLPRGNWPVTTGKIILVVGKPVKTGKLKTRDRKKLTADAKKWISETIEKTRKEQNRARNK